MRGGEGEGAVCRVGAEVRKSASLSRLPAPERPAMTTNSPQTLTLLRPDDWHLHVRDGDAMAAVVPATARQFGRAIVMPNLRPPVTTAEQAIAYRDRIRAAVPAGLSFEPLMVLYLTDNTPADEVARAKAMGAVAFKLYPAGATTRQRCGRDRPAQDATRRSKRCSAKAWCSACTVRSPTARSMCSTAKRPSSTTS